MSQFNHTALVSLNQHFTNNYNITDGINFCSSSANFESNRNDSNKKLIICGGENDNETEFRELMFDNNNNNNIAQKLTFLKNSKNKKNSNIKCFGKNNGQDLKTFLTKDNKNIIVFDCDWRGSKGYNVYNIENDKWLLKNNKKNINGLYDTSNILFINDKLIFHNVRMMKM